MNPIRKAIGRMLLGKAFDPLANIDVDRVGWHKAYTSGSNTYDHYRYSDYENAYPSIKAIANTFLTIEPFAVDDNDKLVDPNALIDRLYFPNQSMSAADFREALAVMTLVHPKVYIRVHHTGSRIIATAERTNITGFTFLEDAMEVVLDGVKRYQLSDGTHLTTDEVIELKNVNPDNLSKGFSPTNAARKWINIDDYIAAYQTGFFRNGAVPAGQFIVTARTVAEFNDIVDQLEAKHKGAGRNNNVSYAHRPVAPDGKALNAQIEWVPFNTTNKDHALKEIFEQVNQKIDSVYGVPASIRGVNEANTYASVRVDELIFMKYVVNPFAFKIWSKFTHELTRLTGGTGFAITYKLELPEMADEMNVKAQALHTDMQTLTVGMQNGFTIKSMVQAFGLPASYTKLKLIERTPIQTPEPTATTTEPEAVDENSERVDDAPTPNTTNSRSVDVKEKVLDPYTRYNYEQQLADVVYEETAQMVARAIEAIDSKGVTKTVHKTKAIEPDEDELIDFTARMLTVVLSLVGVEGAHQREQAISMLLIAGIDPDTVPEFKLTQAQRTKYAQYLRKVGTSYTTTTAETLRTIMANGYNEGLNAGQIKQQLQGVLDQQWRINRLTHTEINRAGTQASVDSMTNIAQDVGVKVEKVWTHTGGDDACDYCVGMIGTTKDVTEDYLGLGATLRASDGSQFVNDFMPVSAGSLHPNCHCLSTFRVRR